MSKDTQMESKPRTTNSGAKDTASSVPIHCAYTELADIAELIPNPRNPNKHGDRQIALLAKIIRHQGWRSPIVVSKRSGFVVAGHGRLEAAKLLQVEQVPVDFQDFATEADEWAHLVADNRIAELAEINQDELAALLRELDGKIDLDVSGFDVNALDGVFGAEIDPSKEWKGMPEFGTDARAHRTIHVHFQDPASVVAFSGKIGKQITENTKSMWFPEPPEKDSTQEYA